jgi:transcriptional regulator with XRE-family HTH domain
MSLNYRAIGHRIMIIRKRHHISQLDFSELIDKSPTYVSYI